LSDYRSVRRALEEEFGADTRVASISTEDIDDYRERMLGEGQLSRRTIQKNLVILHGILKRAKRKEWIAANPAEDAERVQVKRSGGFNVLTPPEIAAVERAAREGDPDAVDADAAAAAMRRTFDELVAAIIVVAADTGLRLGERRHCVGTRRLRDGQPFVRRNLPSHGDEKEPKSYRIRSLPLIDQAAVVLDSLSRREHFTDPGDRVFCSPTGSPFDDGGVRDGRSRRSSCCCTAC
jgi:integrase